MVAELESVPPSIELPIKEIVRGAVGYVGRWVMTGIPRDCIHDRPK